MGIREGGPTSLGVWANPPINLAQTPSWATRCRDPMSANRTVESASSIRNQIPIRATQVGNAWLDQLAVRSGWDTTTRQTVSRKIP